MAAEIEKDEVINTETEVEAGTETVTEVGTEEQKTDAESKETKTQKKPAKAKASKESTEKTDADKAVEGRLNALNRALANIEKDFGKGAVMRFGDKAVNTAIDVIPTGSLGLDVALGTGGIPRGRIVEVYGAEASGKTTLTLHIVAEAQKMGGIAAFIDAEHALDPVYAKKLGVNIDELYISQPDDGEQALDIAEQMVRSSAIDVIIIDSVAALVPRAEIEGDMGASHMGVQARLMSQALRKLTAICNKSNSIIIFTNQLRQKIGVVYGNPETTTGGRALKFYASVRLEVKRGAAIKSGDKQIGSRTSVKVAKNKLAPPFKTCEFDIIFGEGLSRMADILDLAVEQDIINKSGSWYSYNEHRMGQGGESAKQFLRDNPEICEEIENEVRKRNNLKTIEEMKNIAVREFVPLEVRKKKPDKKGSKDRNKAPAQAEEVEIQNEADYYEDYEPSDD